MSAANWKMFKVFAGVAGLFLTLVIALGFKIYYALKTDQPVMTGEYYEIGRNFDEYRERTRNQSDRALSSPAIPSANARSSDRQTAYLRTGVNRVPVSYIRTPTGSAEPSPAAGPIDRATIALVLSRKATVNQDVSGECVTDASGTCELQITIPRGGYWEGRFQATESTGGGRFVVRRIYDIPE